MVCILFREMSFLSVLNFYCMCLNICWTFDHQLHAIQKETCLLLVFWLIAVIWDVFLVSNLVNASPEKHDFEHCERTVKKWASSSLDLEVKEDKHKLQDLLFFLHVPRTGGRTYFHW